MSADSLYWLWLAKLRGIGPQLGKRLLAVFSDPQSIYGASKTELLTVPGIGEKLADSILKERSLKKAQSSLDKIRRNKMHLVSWDDPLYPPRVKLAPAAPLLFLYRGKLRQKAGVAIIGARRCSPYAKQVACEAASFLAARDIPVLGGLSKGVEGYAHTACLQQDGYTLAFLGHSLERCYPKEHQSLLEAIIEKGAAVSQFLPGTPAHPSNFLKRNYLLSAWMSKLLVVQAKKKSATFTTVQYVRQLKKPFFAVPHSIYDQEAFL